MTTSTRQTSSLKRGMAIGIATAIAASAPTPAWGAASRSNSATETGRQSDLVNRPGCWSESGYDNRIPCEVAGGH